MDAMYPVECPKDSWIINEGDVGSVVYVLEGALLPSVLCLLLLIRFFCKTLETSRALINSVVCEDTWNRGIPSESRQCHLVGTQAVPLRSARLTAAWHVVRVESVARPRHPSTSGSTRMRSASRRASGQCERSDVMRWLHQLWLMRQQTSHRNKYIVKEMEMGLMRVARSRARARTST